MQIIENPILKHKTTMLLGGKAHQELVIESYNDADTLLYHIQKEQLPSYILGGGSNVLIDAEPLDACIIRNAYSFPFTVIENSDTFIHIKAPTSMPLQRFVMSAMQHGAKGFEGLAGVPGTLGGAIAMNAGSFGSEITNSLSSIDILSLTDGIMRWNKKDWIAQYRSFILPIQPASYISLSAEFRCQKEPPETLLNTFKRNLEIKKERQPLKAHSAGCVFKNPLQDNSAGTLLDSAGMKTIHTEHFAFSHKHANFLVHDGNGSLDEALSLLNNAKKRIAELYGINLQLEVRIWTTRYIDTLPI